MALRSFYRKNQTEAGLDEAGRGCLAGPVVAAAVILPENYQHSVLNDSKSLSRILRLKVREDIKNDAIAYGVGIVWNEKIDEINILNASFLAMHLALDQIKQNIDFLLIDGNRFTKYKEISHQCIVKGDGKYLAIAAASVLAKTTRDAIMEDLHQQYPAYHWDQNKGYPTKHHRRAIMDNGITPYHRLSFNLNPQLSLKI
ncbi:MAG: ribonuclease HII [Bacteroidales bacterium]